MGADRARMRGMWRPGATFWHPDNLLQQLQHTPPSHTSQMEPLMEPGNEVEFQEYQMDEETNVSSLDSSKHPGPMALPSIMLPAIPAMPTLVPRRGLLVLRWAGPEQPSLESSFLSESGSSQLTRRQGVGLVSIITTIRCISS